MIDYYTIHCGTCETISWLMDSRDIPYKVIDQEEEVKEAMIRYHTETFPFAVIDGVFLDVQQLLKYIQEYNS